VEIIENPLKDIKNKEIKAASLSSEKLYIAFRDNTL
jgi:hypothetical protein